MKILLVSATELEIRPFLTRINQRKIENGYAENIELKGISIDVLITGIGLVFISHKLTKTLNKKRYDLVINAGIAGSFNKNLNIGEVVLVGLEEFGDLGVEDDMGFHTVFERGFIGKNEFPFENGCLKTKLPEKLKLPEFKQVKGLSSNTTHGNEKNIRELLRKFQADIETMEGAAFFYVCLMENADFIEIRAISNYVEIRDVSKWNIPLAAQNLSDSLFKIIEPTGK